MNRVENRPIDTCQTVDLRVTTHRSRDASGISGRFETSARGATSQNACPPMRPTSHAVARRRRPRCVERRWTPCTISPTSDSYDSRRRSNSIDTTRWSSASPGETPVTCAISVSSPTGGANVPRTYTRCPISSRPAAFRERIFNPIGNMSCTMPRTIEERSSVGTNSTSDINARPASCGMNVLRGSTVRWPGIVSRYP